MKRIIRVVVGGCVVSIQADNETSLNHFRSHYEYAFLQLKMCGVIRILKCEVSFGEKHILNINDNDSQANRM